MASYTIEEIFKVFRLHLSKHLDRIRCFNQYEFVAEYWLKTEWLTLLHDLRRKGHISNLDREIVTKVQGEKRKIDLAVELDTGRHWIELKHWLIGKQKRGRWRLPDYIDVLEKDFYNFESVSAGTRAWVAVLCTANPTPTAWRDMLRQFNQEYAPWRLQSLDNPTHYPDSYFLGILRARGLDG